MHGSVLGFFGYGALQMGEVAGRRVLEVGSLNVNGSVRPMVEARQPASYVGVDVVAGPGVDQVGDAVHLADTFGPDSFDVVVSTEMLEHAEDWQAAVANMVAVLAPGGVLVITTRSVGFGYHHPPDRWRYTQQAFAEILQRLALDPIVVMDDPEYPGVFVKARKPTSWQVATGPVDGKVVARTLAGALRRRVVEGVTAMVEPQRWLGLPANPDGCGYYRFWQPWRQLELHSGQDILIPPAGRHQLIPSDAQVEQVQLLAQQRPGGDWVGDWRRWAKLGPALVFEADDNMLQPDPAGLPHWLDPEHRQSVLDCLGLADLVTVSTEPLAEVYRPHTPAEVRVVPNLIHADLLTMARPQRRNTVVGWAGGLSHLRDWVQVADSIAVAASTAELHFMGWDFSSLIRGRVPARFTPFQPDIWDYYRSIDFDLAVIPLADTPFARCRSSIKALEMAALGIPVVASDLEPYRQFVIDGVTGYLADTPTEWTARVAELVADREAREAMGAKAREHAAAYTIQRGWTAWADAYQAAMAAKGR